MQGDVRGAQLLEQLNNVNFVCPPSCRRCNFDAPNFWCDIGCGGGQWNALELHTAPLMRSTSYLLTYFEPPNTRLPLFHPRPPVLCKKHVTVYHHGKWNAWSPFISHEATCAGCFNGSEADAPHEAVCVHQKDVAFTFQTENSEMPIFCEKCYVYSIYRNTDFVSMNASLRVSIYSPCTHVVEISNKLCRVFFSAESRTHLKTLSSFL